MKKQSDTKLYRDSYTVRMAAYGEWMICLICAAIVFPATWLFIVGCFIFVPDAIFAGRFLIRGGVSFNDHDKSVKIINFYRTYQYHVDSVVRFELKSFKSFLAFTGNGCYIVFSDGKERKIRAIMQPLQTRYPDRYARDQQLLQDLNEKLSAMKTGDAETDTLSENITAT